MPPRPVSETSESLAPVAEASEGVVIGKMSLIPVSDAPESLAPVGEASEGMVIGSMPAILVSDAADSLAPVVEASDVTGAGRIAVVSLALGSSGSVVGTDRGKDGRPVRPSSVSELL